MWTVNFDAANAKVSNGGKSFTFNHLLMCVNLRAEKMLSDAVGNSVMDDGIVKNDMIRVTQR